MSEHRFFPYMLIIGAGVIWGATFSLALIATSSGAHPLAIATWHVVLSGIFFIIFCLATGVRLFRIRRLRDYTLVALSGITLPNLIYYTAAPHLSAGLLSITVSSVPLFTYAIMMLMRYEALVIKRVVGILLGMLAILLLVLPDQGLGADDVNFWIWLVVLCALLYAIENVYIGHGVEPDVDVRELLCGSHIVAVVLQLPLTLVLGVGEPVSWLAGDAGLALIGLALSSGVAYSLYFHAIKTAGAVFASQCAYVVTISGVVWGILIFSEQHSLWVWSSVVVMLAGLFLVVPLKKRLSATSTEPVMVGPGI